MCGHLLGRIIFRLKFTLIYHLSMIKILEKGFSSKWRSVTLYFVMQWKKTVKTLTLAVITFRPAAYPRLQCYWGNQPLPEVSWELESKVPLPKTEKSANLAHFFESGHILRIKNPMSNLRGSRSGLNYCLLGKLPSNFQGSKSWWGKFPHLPQWWIRPWFRQLCFELNPESPFFFYTSIHLDENMST